MADLTRAFLWEKTPVGPIGEWPQALFIMVNTLLTSRHPMFLWWGEELIQFCNDAYRPCIREVKHPRALGQPGEECWQEIWHIIGPQIDAVMTRGEASWHENQVVPIFRNGRLEDVYWTVRDTAGTVRVSPHPEQNLCAVLHDQGAQGQWLWPLDKPPNR